MQCRLHVPSSITPCCSARHMGQIPIQLSIAASTAPDRRLATQLENDATPVFDDQIFALCQAVCALKTYLRMGVWKLPPGCTTKWPASRGASASALPRPLKLPPNMGARGDSAMLMLCITDTSRL